MVPIQCSVYPLIIISAKKKASVHQRWLSFIEKRSLCLHVANSFSRPCLIDKACEGDILIEIPPLVHTSEILSVAPVLTAEQEATLLAQVAAGDHRSFSNACRSQFTHWSLRLLLRYPGKGLRHA